MAIEDIKPSMTVNKTNATVNDPGITFNEPGITFNEAGITFGGVGADAGIEVLPIIASVQDIKPRIAEFEDIDSTTP